MKKVSVVLAALIGQEKIGGQKCEPHQRQTQQWCHQRHIPQSWNLSLECRGYTRKMAGLHRKARMLRNQAWYSKLQVARTDLVAQLHTFCPFWLHTFIYLNSPELHCWLSSRPSCIKMLGLCFRVYVRRSQGAGTDPAKDSMPRACRRGQGLPSDLPKDSLCLHLVVIDCKFVVRKVFGMTLPKTACPRHAIVS